MNPPALVDITTAAFLTLLAALTYLVRRYYRPLYIPMAMLAFAIAVAFINNMYAPYYVVRPIGLVNYATNYTTVVNSTTTTYQATVTKTLYTQDATAATESYLLMAIALVSALIGMGLAFIVTLRRLMRMR